MTAEDIAKAVQEAIDRETRRCIRIIKRSALERNCPGDGDYIIRRLHQDAEKVVWIPEAPSHPGLYAVDPNRCNSGINATNNAHEARQFATKELCENWCDMNPFPIFKPQEHGFAD
jgi:hypothetical protein